MVELKVPFGRIYQSLERGVVPTELKRLICVGYIQCIAVIYRI